MRVITMIDDVKFVDFTILKKAADKLIGYYEQRGSITISTVEQITCAAKAQGLREFIAEVEELIKEEQL